MSDCMLWLMMMGGKKEKKRKLFLESIALLLLDVFAAHALPSPFTSCPSPPVPHSHLPSCLPIPSASLPPLPPLPSSHTHTLSLCLPLPLLSLSLFLLASSKNFQERWWKLTVGNLVGIKLGRHDGAVLLIEVGRRGGGGRGEAAGVRGEGGGKEKRHKSMCLVCVCV